MPFGALVTSDATTPVRARRRSSGHRRSVARPAASVSLPRAGQRRALSGGGHRALSLRRSRDTAPRKAVSAPRDGTTDVLLRVPLLVVRAGNDRVFGDEMVFLLRRDKGRYRIRQLIEDFQLPDRQGFAIELFLLLTLTFWHPQRGTLHPMGRWQKLRLPVFGAMIVLAGPARCSCSLDEIERSRIEEVAASTGAASASAPPVVARPDASPLGDLTHVDVAISTRRSSSGRPSGAAARASSRSSRAPVVGTQVDLSAPGSELVYQFAAGVDATGREQPPGRLALRVTREGIKPCAASEPATSPGGEPNCVSDAAAKAARASGIPANQPMKLRYEVDRALRRGVWIATAPWPARSRKSHRRKDVRDLVRH